MEQKRVLLCLCHMGGHEMDFIKEAFDDNWVVPLGPNVNGFEKDLENFVNTDPEGERISDRPVVALASGTAAVHLALIQCGVGPGDEVMVQSFTFAATVNPVCYLGAQPVFVDSEPTTWNIDPDLLDKAIEDRIKVKGAVPKAIVVAELYGMPAQLDRINRIARKWNIPVIEDAAEAFGSRYNGKMCGTFGKFGIMSFNGNKMITTSGGGALICPDEKAAEKTLFLATQAREKYPFYQHEEIGYNYRMSNICAGIGRGQMMIAEEHLAHHRHIQNIYKECFKDSPLIRLHENPYDLYDSNFWLCAITIAPEAKVKGADFIDSKGPFRGLENVEALRLALDKLGVESRPLWKPLHLQPVYADNARYTNGVSEDLFSRGLCIPAGPWVTDDDARMIAETIKSVVTKKEVNS